MAERAGVPTDIAEFEQALAECVAIAGRAMPDSPMLSIVLCRDGEIPTVACSDSVAELLDGLQRATGQGPVLDVIRDGGPVTSDDLRAESRWPRFSAAAGQVRGVHCEPLESAGVLLGVLTLYASRPGGFADETWTAMRVTAAHVGGAVPCGARRGAHAGGGRAAQGGADHARSDRPGARHRHGAAPVHRAAGVRAVTADLAGPQRQGAPDRRLDRGEGERRAAPPLPLRRTPTEDIRLTRRRGAPTTRAE
ncbi:GAF domain-containing protein [Nonomuraea salmonea]|uniref:GAF domain-containing protein n=1 Tax=Nonomuraea salmonea TaxID=46181 RepID=UPI0031E8109B